MPARVAEPSRKRMAPKDSAKLPRTLLDFLLGDRQIYRMRLADYSGVVALAVNSEAPGHLERFSPSS